MKFYFRLRVRKNYIALFTPLFAARLAWNLEACGRYLLESGWTFGFLPINSDFSIEEGKPLYRYHWADIALIAPQFK